MSNHKNFKAAPGSNKNYVNLTLRLPHTIKNKIEESALKIGRSMNQEVIAILQESLTLRDENKKLINEIEKLRNLLIAHHSQNLTGVDHE